MKSAVILSVVVLVAVPSTPPETVNFDSAMAGQPPSGLDSDQNRKR